MEPSASQRIDFFKAEYAAVYERDIPRMAAIGANALRIYDFEGLSRDTQTVPSHTGFFDACLRNNISVLGQFELSPSSYDLTDELGRRLAREDLRNQLEELRTAPHDAVGMWLVGNELNLPAKGFLCGDPPADASGRRLSSSNQTCQFSGAGVATLFGVVNELCGIVKSEFGMLCSTALAEVPVPQTYRATLAYNLSSGAMEGATAWFEALDYIMPNVDLWAANVYPTGSTHWAGGFGEWFFQAEGRTTKPVLLTEYGIDAFDSGTTHTPAGVASPATWNNRMREDGVSQARIVQAANEQIERSAVTCLHNCDTHVRAERSPRTQPRDTQACPARRAGCERCTPYTSTRAHTHTHTSWR
jgi:hypothetical protein